jgi:hypothetical protein
MLIDWFKLAATLLILLTPIGLFHGKKVRHRSLTRDWSGYWGHTFTLGLHWIDLGRAVIGGWLLLEALTLAPGARSTLRYAVPLAHGAIMALAIILQTFVCKDRDHANAPFAFVAGATLGLFSPVIAGFSIMLALIVALGARVPLVYFPVLALALPGLGFLFEGQKALLTVGIGGAVVMLPWLLTIMFPRDLVASYRARRPSSAESAEAAQPRR